MRAFNLIGGKVNRFVQQLVKPIFGLLFVLNMTLIMNAQAETALADNPLFSTNGVPGNVALALSVEFPTALGSAYTSSYDNTKEFVGYWDANKCYTYNAAASGATATFQGPYNTGVSDSNNVRSSGQNDPHWTALASPSPLTTNNARKLNNGWGSVYSDSNSAYIGGNAGVGTIIYQTTFNIPSSFDPTKVQISFQLYADDRLDRVRVDGVNLGISAPSISYNSPGIITIPAGTFTTTGSHTLTLDIYNTGGLGGMRIDNMSSTTVAAASADGSYFAPAAIAAANHVCNTGAVKYWSGNFLNWALTQTIDPFRYALSGGYRAVDKVDLTILEKAWATGQGGTVATPTISGNASLIAKSTPFQSLADIKIKINGLGNKFYITSTGNLNSPGASFVADGGLNGATDGSKVYEAYARVKVCDPTMLETNCTKYPSGQFKPTGLIQKNAMKLNFAAFGYLLDDDIKRDGGVLRARMGPLGPEKPVPGSSAVSNPNAEWDAFTGVFYDNPNSADATASGVSNSGVINYLNKFGLTANKYKTYDPVGELYYTATRYLKHQGNVSSYTSGLDATKKDGFPVITDWYGSINEYDPVKYSCQTNFIIGIGDTNTHADSNLPGSTIATDTSKEPSQPTEVAADNTVNARIATNKVAELQGIGGSYTNLGQKYTPWCCNNNSFLMSGIAYDNHTKDIRSDFTGVQTIDTYFLDVLESGDRKDNTVTGMRNQFWLAAKYGGFDVPNGFGTYTATSADAPPTSAWDADGNGDPDNYFRANNPQLMIDGLTAAFNDIVIKSGKGISDGFAVVKPTIISGDIALGTSYDGDGWTGDVVGSTVTFDAQDRPIVTTVWNAVNKLEAQDWETGRSIATSNCTAAANGGRSCTGVAFRDAADLSASSVADLQVLGNTAQDVVDFIRGDRSGEGGVNNFRIRKKILGDINNSKITLVGPPNTPLNDSFNPGYSAFKSTYSARPLMAYVGANDGMLHAFNAIPNTTGGTEQFAYIPNMLFNGPNATPNIDGLVALTKNPYLHHHYVDSTPTVQDVDFGGGSPDWHTLLVGGLGKGGKGYFAIDVTNPASLNNETTLASAVKWEFTEDDLGYTFSEPVIVKINNTTVSYAGNTGYKGWAVILTSGYNNTNKNGYFYVLNPKDGSLIAKVPTYATPPATDAGLASPNVLINNSQDYTADAAYAGDLHGNLWRLNLKDFSITKLATLKDSANNTQPITVRPRVSIDRITSKRYILIGTGKLLDDSDAGNTQTQTVYAIQDGVSTTGGYFTSSTLPSGVTFPIGRSNLNNNSVLFATTGIQSPAINSVGWYLDLADNYIINEEMQVNAGVVYIAANKISGGACDSTASNRLFQLDVVTGATLTSVPFEQSAGIVKDITLYRNATTNPNSPVKVLSEIQLPDGSKQNKVGLDKNPGAGLNFKQLNWRDLPTAD